MKFVSVFLLAMLAASCGYGSNYNSTNGTPPPATPNITSLAPGSASAGGQAFVLTVNGTGFASNSTIYWDSSSISTTFVNAQQIMATIPAGDIASSGTVSVFVKNPGSGIYATGVNSNTETFTIGN